jgi:hypothetical protein
VRRSHFDPFQTWSPSSGKRLGAKPYDVETDGDYWLIPARAKKLFDELNMADFAYLAVDTEFDPGSDPDSSAPG